ncbi:MAG: helix-turn-helix domain-containing protein [Phycisphaeraceae bacterium]|nr:helix-turn-helix domain-containing protein [Phycisphaeraceae bacterium]
MTDPSPTIVDRTDGQPRNAGPGVLPAMLTIDQVARLLNCSTRTVYRLNDAGRMPRPVRLGSLVRWNRSEIEQWIADGCPAVKGDR